MYHHVKELMYTVHVDTPNPRFGNMLLEQFGGPNGELAAAEADPLISIVAGSGCRRGARQDYLREPA